MHEQAWAQQQGGAGPVSGHVFIHVRGLVFAPWHLVNASRHALALWAVRAPSCFFVPPQSANVAIRYPNPSHGGQTSGGHWARRARQACRSWPIQVWRVIPLKGVFGRGCTVWVGARAMRPGQAHSRGAGTNGRSAQPAGTSPAGVAGAMRQRTESPTLRRPPCTTWAVTPP